MSSTDIQWLANFGFAAVVAGYLLLRIEPAISRLDKSIRLLTIVVARSSGQDPDQVERDFMANGGHKR